MALSLLQHLRETQGAELVAEITKNYGLTTEKATGFINAGLALVVGRLVNINQTQGTSAVLDILKRQDSVLLWMGSDLSNAQKELTGLVAIDEVTSLQALNLIAERSLVEINTLEQAASLGKEGLNELLDGQAVHLQGHFPDWIYTAAGLPALIGLSVFNTIKESVVSLGDVLRQASDAVTHTVTSTATDVAQKTSDAASVTLDTISKTTSSIVNNTAEIATKTTAAASSAVIATGQAAANAIHAAGDVAQKSVKAAGNLTVDAVKEPTSFLLRILPWIGFIFLILLSLLFWKGCQNQTVPVVASATNIANTTPISLSPQQLSLNTGANGELLNCKGVAGNADLLANLTSAVQAQFGPAAKCDIKIDATVETSFAGLSSLSDALGAVKASANTSFELSGNTVTINNAQPVTIAKLIERLKTLFGTGMTIVSAVPLDPTLVAGSALANINPNMVNAKDVIHALNMQVINFAVGSNDIPDVNKTVLDQATTLIKAIPEFKMTITGHTDSSGNEKSNVALSLVRAKSVAAYLVSKGIPASSITTKGAGSSQSIADNATAEGQLKNRRIEFSIPQSDAS
jgi:outer membrane protein OmpA-like peptidoglycan-associated protein